MSIVISIGNSRTTKKWSHKTMSWQDLLDQISVTKETAETLPEYFGLSKKEQSNIKDVGGFVGGVLTNGIRKKENIECRYVLTLDADYAEQDIWDKVKSLGFTCCMYSTHRHTPENPRYRLVFPFMRTTSGDEYQAIGRMIANDIGIEQFDHTTYDPVRIMYWPSTSRGAEYVFKEFKGEPIDPDKTLARYSNWKNTGDWPKSVRESTWIDKEIKKQADPRTKGGMIGAFCRVYDIETAIEEFLPDIYEVCERMPNRYSYIPADSIGGVVLYDDVFAYSHHASDPVSGKLLNAFDLVRLHKFGAMDEDAEEGTPTNRMPSYKAMCGFAIKRPEVALLIAQDAHAGAAEDFDNPEERHDLNWTSKLAVNSNGNYCKTSKNVRIVLEHDPRLKGRIRLNKFSNEIIAVSPLPWAGRSNEPDGKTSRWTDADDAGLFEYIEQFLGYRNKDLILGALVLTAMEQGFNPVIDYLESLTWDGELRLDTLFIDYLGAEDCEYMKTITRKALVAAIARAMTPGVKYDTMTVIHGKQGLGKSTILAKLGKDWFSDSVYTLEGKEGAELLQNAWIVEISELGAYNKSGVESVKSFLSKKDDQFRASYGRNVGKYPRKCVFFGTTNEFDYLKDVTGGRRFWPVTASIIQPKKSVFTDLTDDEVDQVWAEAVVKWRGGETIFLTPELEAEAEKRRAIHTERDPVTGMIEEFLERPVPTDWINWTLARRLDFWNGLEEEKLELAPRDRVCAIEIWRECLKEFRSNLSQGDTRRLNSIVSTFKGWERSGIIRFGEDYGKQRGFIRNLEKV